MEAWYPSLSQLSGMKENPKWMVAGRGHISFNMNKKVLCALSITP
jgi:hypothetical protein